VGWQVKSAAVSLLSNRDVTVIPYGLDTGVFKPRATAPPRANCLNCPLAARSCCSWADRANEHRKGLPLLVEALKALPDRCNVCLLILGNGRVELPDDFQTVPVGVCAQ